jgi:hypothetical protein
MLTIFMAIAAAYLFGLGAIGGMFILVSLQIKREQGKLSGLVMKILTGINGCLTISGMLVLVILWTERKENAADEVLFAFATTSFVMLGLLFAVAKEWNQLLQRLK